MSKNFEQLLEYVVNNETEKAQALFHDIVVGKSREIYENMIAAEMENSEEAVGGDEVEELLAELGAEEGVVTSEGEDMDMEADATGGDDEDMEMDMGGGDEDMDMGGDDMGGDDMGGDEDMGDAGAEDMEDRLVDLETALDQLKAEFAELMGDEEEGEEDEGEEDEGEEDEEEPVMEYVEKVQKPVESEEGPVNKTSPVAGNAKSPIGGEPVRVKDGSEGQHGHGSKSAPKPGKLTNATTQGAGTKMTKAPAPKKA